MKGDTVAKKRRAVEPPALDDGYYWYRNFVNLTGGGHVGEWKLARIVRGRVQRVGSAAVIDRGCPYLRNALWVRAEPPSADAADATAITAVGRATRGDRAVATPDEDKVRRVAAEVVDVFVGLSDAMAAYYNRHADHRDDLVAVVARIMLKAVR